MVIPASHTGAPLVVDMDGTLLTTDTLWESVLLLLKRNPLTVFLFPTWILKGKAFFKRQIAERVVLNPALLPYRQEVLTFIEEEKKSGKDVILASAADQKIAEKIADYLGLFSAVLASDGKLNLSAGNKLKALEKHLQNNKFDYMGNSADDIPLWRAADRAILVHPSSRLLKQTRSLFLAAGVLCQQRNKFRSLLKALRIHQWVKNMLVFVPLIMAHKVADAELLVKGLYAFLAFGLCASSVYVVNDLLDLEADRQHPYKKDRPFAAGTLQIQTGVLLVPLLLGSAFGIALSLLSPFFSASLVLYLVLSTAYSFYFKRVVIIDVLLLAALYSLRVLAGAIAVSVAISPWLLAFAMFFFLSLAFLKRYSELRMTHLRRGTQASGRGYAVIDIDLLRSIGPTSSYLSVLVLALYINSKEVTGLYTHPMALWLIEPPLLYWLTRMWFLAHRGDMTDDPIVFAINDGNSYAVGALVATIIVVASL